MANRRRWKREDTEALREHFANGHTLGETAGLMGYAPSTISGKAKELGLDWSRKYMVAKAVQANAMTNLQKRAELETKMLDTALQLIEQYTQPYQAFSFGGKDNDFNSHILDSMPADAQKHVAGAIGIFADRALKLAESNNQVRDLSDVDAWLADLTGIPAEPPTEMSTT